MQSIQMICGFGVFPGVFLVILLMSICALSEVARYRAKFIIFAVLCAVAATWSIPIMFLRIGNWKNGLIPAWGARQTAKLLGIKYVIRGKENIVKDRGTVVLINHQSSLDLCVLAELWPVLDRCTVIAKKVVMYFGTFGLAAWLWGTIFINRSKAKEAQESINSTSKIIKERKARLLMFPEGKRYNGSELMPFKKGGFHVAIASQLPIQPIVISRYYFINSKLKRFNSGTCFITILPPIETKDMTKENLQELIDHTHDVMNKEFQESTQEVLTAHIKTLKSE